MEKITLSPITVDSPYYDVDIPAHGAHNVPFVCDSLKDPYVDITVDDDDPDGVVLRVYSKDSPTSFESEDGSLFEFDREPVDAYQGTREQLDALVLPLTYDQLKEWYHLGH